MGKGYTEQAASVETRKRERDRGRPRPRDCWLGVDLGHGGTSQLRGSINTTTIGSHITERFLSENHREVNTASGDSQKQEPHIADEHMPNHLCHGPLCMYLSSFCIYLGIQPGPSPNLMSTQYLQETSRIMLATQSTHFPLQPSPKRRDRNSYYISPSQHHLRKHCHGCRFLQRSKQANQPDTHTHSLGEDGGRERER